MGQAKVMTAGVKWSVILVSRNGADTLPLALETLAAMRLPQAGCEFLLVDNASTDETPALMAAFTKGRDARVLSEPRPGKSYGLNAAIDAAAGDWLAFIDDDIILTPGWLEAFDAATAQGGAVLAGSIAPHWLAPAPRWLAHLAEEGRALGCTDPEAPAGPYPHAQVKGGNFAVARSALGSLRFDAGAVNFGTGRRATGGEDVRIVAALAAAGTPVMHVPQARGGHVISPDEVRIGAAFARFVRIGRSSAAVAGTGRAAALSLALKSMVWLVAAVALAPFSARLAGRSLASLGTTLGRLDAAISRASG